MQGKWWYYVGMVVYVEFVILNNLLANYCVLRLTQKLSGLKVGKFRKILFLSLSVVSGVLTPLLTIPEYLTVGVKLLLSVFFVKILSKKCGFRRFLVHFFIFYASSFVVAGGVAGILSMTSFGIEGYESEELTFCILVGCLVVTYIVGQILSYLKSRVDKGECTIIFRGVKGDLTLSAFVDTGNCVKVDGVGVTFIPKVYKDDIARSDIIRYITVTTLNGAKVYAVYNICEMSFAQSGKKRGNFPAVFWDGGRENRVILSEGEKNESVC